MKSMIVAEKPQYMKSVASGEKDIEIRTWKVPLGTVLYFYESKGKKYKGFIGYNGVKYDTEYEGRGKVVAKAVVKENHKLMFNNVLDMVYSDKLAYNDIKRRAKVDITYFEPEKEYWALGLSNVQEIEPRDITEFVSWSKLDKAYDDRVEWCYRQGMFPPMTREQWMEQANCIDDETLEECNLTNAPQSRVWIYEEETK